MSIEIKEFYVFMNENGEYFSKDPYSGGYPFWSKYLESAEQYKNMERVKKDKYYFKMFKDFFDKSKLCKVTIKTSIDIEGIEFYDTKN